MSTLDSNPLISSGKSATMIVMNGRSTIQEIRSELMALSASERASLAHDLILSLDNPADYELGSAQESAIWRRVKTVREGTACGRAAKDVFAAIKAKHS